MVVKIPEACQIIIGQVSIRIAGRGANPTIEGPILDRLGQMFRGDPFAPCEIGDGPRHPQNGIAGTCRKTEMEDGTVQEAASRRIGTGVAQQ